MITAVDTNILIDVFGADPQFGHASLYALKQCAAADFLIAAHSLVQSNRLLTRDRGFYQKYFSELSILDPSTLQP